MNILICGDSFAADWTVKYEGVGWPNLLANQHAVTNIAQAGCSQYKIYQQLRSANLDDYDWIIVFHTSPYRLYTEKHPIHYSDPLHCNSDLIYSDIKAHVNSTPCLEPIVEYFERHFDTNRAIRAHTEICKRIHRLLLNNNVVHATGIDWEGLYRFPKMLYFNEIHRLFKGNMNHFTVEGNILILQKLLMRLNDG